VKKYIYSELFFILNIFDHKKFSMVPKISIWCLIARMAGRN